MEDINFHNFIFYTTPHLHPSCLETTEAQTAGTGDGRGDALRLKHVWESLDEPYGHEVPLTFPSSPIRNSDAFAFYVPYLSGLQLYRSTDSVRRGAGGKRQRAENSDNKSNIAETHRGGGLMNGSASDHERRQGALLLDSESSDADDIVVGDNDEDNNGATHSGAGADAAVLDGNEDAELEVEDVGARARARPGGAESESELILEYFETAKPNDRAPLVDKVNSLRRDCPLLYEGTTADLDVNRSWFALSWYPILCDPYTNRLLSGCFLAYYTFDVVEDCPFSLSTGTGVSTLRKNGGAYPADCPIACVQHDCARSNCVFVSLTGVIPYKVKRDTWFCGPDAEMSLVVLRQGAVSFTKDRRLRHPDYMHMIRSASSEQPF